MGDENPIHILEDYSKPSHEGHQNTIELPEGNNVVPLRSKTPISGVDVKDKVERKADDKPAKSAKEEVTKNKEEEPAGVSSSHTVGYYLKHRINEKLIEGLIIGGLKNMNALVDQGSDVNVIPLSIYNKLTDERPAETDIRLSLASHSYIYPLGITEDVLVDVVGYVYPMDFVILDIKENKKRPFILETPFFLSLQLKGRILKPQLRVEKGIKNDIEPIAPTMTVNRLVLEWEEKFKLHQEKEVKFDQWRSKTFNNERPALVEEKCKFEDEGGVTALDDPTPGGKDRPDQAKDASGTGSTKELRRSEAKADGVRSWRQSYAQGLTLERSRTVRLELPQELSRVHHTFHVSNLKKCYADEPLVMPLEGIHVDDKLQFVEEPVEIMEREIKRLKRSRIPLVKVRWNSRRGPEFTWEREDSFKQKYPQLFTNRASSSTTRFEGVTDWYQSLVTMSSATSDVTYTSVYTDSEPGRVFWGADDEEISEGGIPRVIVLGYDGLPLQPVAPPSPDFIPGPENPQTPPVPQEEDEREPMFIQAHDPNYVPEPIYPEYIPLEDDHEFPAEEQPLPPVDSPTAESPGYVTESDPEEDPEGYEDDETEDGPVDYPMDGGDDGD
ncbi:putative reverse transcriptase domain-containing protein [Tanacetum coccineum]